MDTRTEPKFSEYLRRARRDAGLTQEELAEQAGISTRAVSDLERGINRAPQQETLRLLADALSVSPDERRLWEAARRRLATRRAHESAAISSEALASGVHIPIPLTSFVGREREALEVVALLHDPSTRVLTLTGPGGVGKTRLALVVANALPGHFPDGVWFVDLAPILDRQRVGSTIASALEVPVSGAEPAMSALISTLRKSRRLLVLDNLEQIPSVAGELVQLLVSCPGLTLLTTSRTPLHVPGEREYAVAPLSLPDDSQIPDIELIARSEAIDLFTQRAAAVTADFRLSEHNARAVAGICRRLDGLPLAIELAAARTRLLPPRSLLARLEQRLPLLTSTSIDVPIRQQTLQNTIAWSYDLLATGEQRLFRALSVFSGGWTLDAVESLAGQLSHADGNDAIALLEALSSHSLVRVREQADGEPRYSMLETIREFASERCNADDDAQELRGWHAQYYLGMAEHVASHLMGTDQLHWLRLLDTEEANLRAVAQWTHQQSSAGVPSAAVLNFRLVSALWWFWHIRGSFGYARQRISNAMEFLISLQGPIRASMTPAEWSDIHARMLMIQGTYRAWPVEQPDASAVPLMKQSAEIYRQLGQKRDLAFSLTLAGYGAQRIGDFADADVLLSEATAVYRELDDRRGVALALQGMGMIALRSGAYDDATDRLRDSLRLFTDLKDERSIAAARATLGASTLRHGDHAAATELLVESLRSRDQLGDKGGIAWCFEWLAEAALAQPHEPRNLARAARLLGAAHELRARINSPIDPVDLPTFERAVTSAQSRMSDIAFVAAWEAGRAMPLEDAVAYALKAR